MEWSKFQNQFLEKTFDIRFHFFKQDTIGTIAPTAILITDSWIWDYIALNLGKSMCLYREVSMKKCCGWKLILMKKQKKRLLQLYERSFNYFPPPNFIYGKGNYSTATVVFLFLFFQTHFANLEFVHFLPCLLHFLNLKRYISDTLYGPFQFFKNLYGTVANDQVPNFQRPKIFWGQIVQLN